MSQLLITTTHLATALKSYELPTSSAGQVAVKTIMSIVFGIIGAFGLLIIVVSGFRYITSNGDAQKVAQAKNGIIYALVGIMIAISAEAIVAFVGNKL